MDLRRAAGFTLLEILIALTILGMISATLFLSLDGALDSLGRVRDAQEPYQRGRVARTFLASSLRSTALFSGIPGDGFVAVDSTSGSVPRDELTFVAGTPPGSRSARMQIRVFVADSAGSPSLRLEVRALAPGDTLPTPETHVLSSDVAGLDIEFLAAAADDKSVWVERWDSRIRIPHAVRIDFVPGPRPDPVYRAPLVVQLPAGRIL